MYREKIEAIDGREIKFPAGSGILTHVCCDCGLTHNIEVAPSTWAGGGFTLVFHKNNRSTGQFRRYMTPTAIAKLSLSERKRIMKGQALRFAKSGKPYPFID